MRIKIDALDTLFFRDGKPFTMGAETWGSGIFPPYPSMVYGTLRSLYFSYNIRELEKAASLDEPNSNDPTAPLTLKGHYIQYRNALIFPTPLDCVEEKGSKEKNLMVLKPQKAQFISNYRTAEILRTDSKKQIKNADDGWIDSSTLGEYLNGNHNSMYYSKLSDSVLSEAKIGIGRNNQTRTAEDSMLYRVGMKRLKDISIVVDIEGLNLSAKSGLMKLGGEGRPASFTVNDSLPIDACELPDNKLKLYLATPAIFTNGWLPKQIDTKTLEGNMNGIKLKLVTAAIGKPVYIGGFDIKKGPKPMKRAVPAGSVYYFELHGSYNKAQVIEAFHNKAISDDEIYKKQGFGIAYVGRWA